MRLKQDVRGFGLKLAPCCKHAVRPGRRIKVSSIELKDLPPVSEYLHCDKIRASFDGETSNAVIRVSRIHKRIPSHLMVVSSASILKRDGEATG